VQFSCVFKKVAPPTNLSLSTLYHLCKYTKSVLSSGVFFGIFEYLLSRTKDKMWWWWWGWW